MKFTKMHGLGNDYLYVYGDVPENIAGLSIVKHAAQYHHGKISVKSECGKGTNISILFDTANE